MMVSNKRKRNDIYTKHEESSTMTYGINVPTFHESPQMYWQHKYPRYTPIESNTREDKQQQLAYSKQRYNLSQDELSFGQQQTRYHGAPHGNPVGVFRHNVNNDYNNSFYNLHFGHLNKYNTYVHY